MDSRLSRDGGPYIIGEPGEPGGNGVDGNAGNVLMKCHTPNMCAIPDRRRKAWVGAGGRSLVSETRIRVSRIGWWLVQ